MSVEDDRWLWFIDDAPLQALLKAEGDTGTMRLRAASSPALVSAMTAHMEGRHADAAVELQRMLAGGETQPEVFLFLGQIHFEEGRYAQAIEVYSSLLARSADHLAAVFNLAVCHEKLSHWDEAASLFAKSAALEPERKDALLGWGLCNLHQRNPEEALRRFEQYLKKDPNNEQALFGRAVALQMLRRFDEATAIYDRFRSSGPPSPELLTNLLALAVARRDPREVVRLASQLGKGTAGASQAAEAVAYTAAQAGNWDDAIAALGQLSALAGGNLTEEWAYLLVYGLWSSEKKKDARTHLDDLLQRNPGHPAGVFLDAVLLEEAGKTAEALASYRKAARYPSVADAADWNIVRLSSAANQLAMCREAARALLSRNRDSAEGLFAEGLACLMEGAAGPAADAFAKVVALRPSWTEAEWNLGLSLFAKGEFSDAERTMGKIYPLIPGKERAEVLARAALANGNPGRALAVLDSAGAGEPALLFNIAVAFHDAAEIGSATDLYRRVMKSPVKFADAHINLGHIRMDAGQIDEAKELWRQAERLEGAVA